MAEIFNFPNDDCVEWAKIQGFLKKELESRGLQKDLIQKIMNEFNKKYAPLLKKVFHARISITDIDILSLSLKEVETEIQGRIDDLIKDVSVHVQKVCMALLGELFTAHTHSTLREE